ncbi:MAG: hypothetical protein N838_16835 [Thiohalocapsa sp. PB-PSB1]|jgi:hypothetical protein|nr:MAG: hypothetical protein N838_16835 [Thiohalocapsa sp. PB-PSB1]
MEHEPLRLSEAEGPVLLDALDYPPEPKARLRQAFAEHGKPVRRLRERRVSPPLAARFGKRLVPFAATG